MKKFVLLSLGAVFFAFIGFGLSAPSRADPAYTANDFVEFFAPDKAAIDSKKRHRTVCFSADDPDPECAPVKPKVRDLRVTFQFGSEILTPSAKETLNQLAIALQNTKLVDARLEIDGHTDAKGREDYNLDLSRRRAQSVVNYLAAKGVDQNRLEAKGFGQSQPAVTDPFASVNRRVEAHIAP